MKSLTLVRRIDASPELVFEALVTAEGMGQWWGPDTGPVLLAESDPRAGGYYRVRFKMEDGSEHEAHGSFLSFDPPRRVVMSFRWVGEADDSGPSHIEIMLKAVGAKTDLTFTHAALPSDEIRKSHENGWLAALDKLQRCFEREVI